MKTDRGQGLTVVSEKETLYSGQNKALPLVLHII